MDDTLRAIVAERQQKRDRFLETLYGSTGGDTLKYIEVDRIGSFIDLGGEEAREVAKSLQRNGYLTIGAGWMLGIQAAGARLVESWARPSSAAPPTLNILNVGHMDGSTVQQGTKDSSQATWGNK